MWEGKGRKLWDLPCLLPRCRLNPKEYGTDRIERRKECKSNQIEFWNEDDGELDVSCSGPNNVDTVLGSEGKSREGHDVTFFFQSVLKIRKGKGLKRKAQQGKERKGKPGGPASLADTI